MSFAVHKLLSIFVFVTVVRVQFQMIVKRQQLDEFHS